ncbi:hypothetical protein GUITHDRAFT_75407 [Guillardia theta CCMP2712]|uniref:Protein kinase domain-containing protein n=1 Tax=Guillardia theta (strain CCMP2712) TaxID=905079 RepID=L1IXL1_GUITC|nr:hypothetical protein GUITHDRAFT_75407 [Guillardia theta CCMP2712]EKX40624.1 hypothetical protein GUITHDRAFT_75407 [Guillardia theta CCMP2712]|eukprot:XP_005827604.1 hypothetical protein GUITHDRAFT_75407 [Guillardia theta CCMP2712]
MQTIANSLGSFDCRSCGKVLLHLRAFEATDLYTAARGLVELHNLGVYHLDFKPANILLDEKMNAKIGDFGLSKVIHNQADTMDSRLLLAMSRTRHSAAGTGQILL